jgi:Holliday junction resolvase RusA-like endonuclease
MNKSILIKFVGKAISKDNEKLISKYPNPKTGQHWTYLSSLYKRYENDLKRQARAQLSIGWERYPNSVWVSLFFYFQSKVHCDITNLPKSICDAMTGILWKNDKQVWLNFVCPFYDKKREEGVTLICYPVTSKEISMLKKFVERAELAGEWK